MYSLMLVEDEQLFIGSAEVDKTSHHQKPERGKRQTVLKYGFSDGFIDFDMLHINFVGGFSFQDDN